MGNYNMTVEDVIAAARAQSGLTDYGDPAILEGLERLLKAYAEEARFTTRGAQMMHGDLINTLATRMQVEDWLAKHPQLLDAPIKKPLFVFGLPRTGTTLMINLLAADPATRSFLRWEIYNPMPPARPEELHAGPRYEAEQAKSKMALEYMPHIAAIHYEEADSPTECQFLMTPSFCAQVYESQADIPSWRSWFLHEADYMPAFRYHKRMLQALQTYAGGRWTLKNPWHPLFLNELTTVYPDARLVMTHRDPAEVVGSACSLIKYVRAIYSDDVDLKGIGESFADTFEVMIARANAFKAKHGADAIYDVQYADTVRDPMAVVRGIYERFDEPLTAEAEAAMLAYLADNPKGKHGSHSYDLAEYGLSVEGVRERFKDYIETYEIPVKD
jgi:Sulfotransferase family